MNSETLRGMKYMILMQYKHSLQVLSVNGIDITEECWPDTNHDMFPMKPCWETAHNNCQICLNCGKEEHNVDERLS